MLDMKKVGIKICTFRKKIGYSQEKLAEMLRISPQAISKWENGHTLPEASLLPVLAQIFSCTIDDIIMPAYTFDEKIEAEKPDTLEKQAEHIAQIIMTKMGDNNLKDSEKEECFPIIFHMVDLAQLVRRRGILSLEFEMEEEQNPILKKGIQLAIDSTDPEQIKEILQSIISADGHKGAELLSRRIISQGIADIANGCNPLQIFERLLGMLGEDYVEKFSKYESFSQYESQYRNAPSMIRVNFEKVMQFLESIADREAVPECEDFEEKLKWARENLYAAVLPLILSDLSREQILTAFYGCNRAATESLSLKVSVSSFVSFIEEWAVMDAPAVEDIVKIQRQIIAKAHEIGVGGPKGTVISFGKRGKMIL
jgi:transcriptional regulator with XRE-family HTH domain